MTRAGSGRSRCELRWTLVSAAWVEWLKVAADLDRLPPAVDHAMVAAVRDGDAWWLLMRDVSDELLDDHSFAPVAAL